MFVPVRIPPQLANRPFTTAEGHRHGISRAVLSSSSRFRSLFRGVWVCADVETTPLMLLEAARLVLPPDAVVSHLSALQLLGIDGLALLPLHFSTNMSRRCRQEGITLHRRQGTLHPQVRSGIPVTGPDRSFVDSAQLLSHRDLVRVGDALVHLGLTTPDQLRAYALARHIDGVRRARRASRFVRAGADSVRETDLRLLLLFARLPEPEVNGWITSDAGITIGRGDLVYRAYRVIVEYDGWHHERDARQRQKDHLRRERLEAAGWRLIVVTAVDLKKPTGVVRRVHDLLVERGYRGPAPVMSTTWHRWFTAA